jgi:hypothetical protein
MSSSADQPAVSLKVPPGVSGGTPPCAPSPRLLLQRLFVASQGDQRSPVEDIPEQVLEDHVRMSFFGELCGLLERLASGIDYDAERVRTVSRVDVVGQPRSKLAGRD